MNSNRTFKIHKTFKVAETFKIPETFKVAENLKDEVNVYLICTPYLTSCPFSGTLREAIELAIKKWQTISNWYRIHPEYKNVRMANTEAHTYALCSIFDASEDASCQLGDLLCPIKKYTGHAGCKETPCHVFYDYSGRKIDYAEAAKEEVAFLLKIKEEVLKDGLENLQVKGGNM
jgi:hypothetical protein